MALPSKLRNEHPVDRLAEVRAQVRELEVEIDNLRATIIADQLLVGDLYRAHIISQDRKTLSRPKLEKVLGKAAVDNCCDVRTVIIVKTLPH